MTYNKEVIKKAVGYIRISTEDQSQYSLQNQEDFITQAAKTNAVELLKIFKDDGFSAKTTNRPGLLEMLEYCRKNKNLISSLYIYKSDRLSRDVYDGIGIRKMLAEYGISIISLTEPNDDTPAGKFISTIFFASAQLDNEIRGQRAHEGMKKRFESGWLPTKPPVGYKNIVDETGRKVIIRDPKIFDIIKQGWTALATGNHNLLQVCKLMSVLGHSMPSQTASRIFRNPFYMGIIRSEKWNLERQGLHEPMVSEEMFYRVQLILKNKTPQILARNKYNALFPLRQFVLCECGAPLTGAWAKGHTKRYAYYYCSKRNHPSISIPKDTIEEAFIKLLQDLTPSKELLKRFVEKVRSRYTLMIDQYKAQQAKVKADITELEKQKDELVKKNLAGTYDDELFKEQFAKIKDKILDKKSIVYESKIEEIDIEKLSNFMYAFLSDLSKVWLNATPEQQQVFMSSMFPKKLVWSKNAYRTPEIEANFTLLEPISPSSEPGGDRFELFIEYYSRLQKSFAPVLALA